MKWLGHIWCPSRGPFYTTLAWIKFDNMNNQSRFVALWRQHHEAGLCTWPDWLTDRQIPRHESCRHAYSVAPQQSPEKLTYQPVNTERLGMVHLPQLSQTPLSANIMAHIHPHKQCGPLIGVSGVKLDENRGWSWQPRSHSDHALTVRLHHLQPWNPSMWYAFRNTGHKTRPCAPVSCLPK